MPGPQANSTNRLRTTLRDNNGALVTNATMTLTVQDPSLVTVLNNVAVPHLGSGVYEYVAAPTIMVVAGAFTAIWDAIDPATHRWHKVEVFIVTL